MISTSQQYMPIKASNMCRGIQSFFRILPSEVYCCKRPQQLLAETMVDYLQKVFTIESYISLNNGNGEQPIDDKAVKISEVIFIIKNLKINKSAGYDLIRVKMIWIHAEIILLHKDRKLLEAISEECSDGRNSGSENKQIENLKSESDQNIQNIEVTLDGTVWQQIIKDPTNGRLSHNFKQVLGPTVYAK
ncbi:hypothetical protein HZH68_011231 [Vespula germanica]|uniref:Uncharacterized protein n=1 Tax=Vespula germanica TaxID=30212 RepID=A0A834JN36_VESGE|nr:hypothetical protein HZH68_011231 [Vespula germanica]